MICRARMALALAAMMLLTATAPAGSGLKAPPSAAHPPYVAGNEPPSAGDNATFYTYETLTDTLREWAAGNPRFVQLHDLTAMIDSRFGFRKTWQGRTIWGVRVSGSPEFDDPDRPKIIIEGSHHGDEWMGFQTAMKLLEVLVKGYGKDSLENLSGIDASLPNWSTARLSWLLDNRDVWVIPMANPDGATYDQSVAASGGTWRKNCRDNDGNGRFDPDQDGVDINRNYPYMWGANMKGLVGPGGSQTTQDTSVWSSSQYHGPPDNHDDDRDAAFPGAPDRWPQHNGPDWNGIDEDPVDGRDNDGDGKVDEDQDGGFSEPETCAVEALFNALDSDGDRRNGKSDVSIAVSLHSYTGCVMWPWGYTDDPGPDDALLSEIGTKMARFPGYDAYKSSDMYRTSGDTSDWFYGSMGALPFVIELGKPGQGGFHPPADMIDNISVPNVEALLYAIEVADVADDAHEMGAPSTGIGTPGLSHSPPRKPLDAGQEFPVYVGVTNSTNLSPDGLKLCYRVDGGSWIPVGMSPAGEGRYRGAIPGQQAGARVEYYIEMKDVFNNTNSLPRYGPYAVFGYDVSGQPFGAIAWALVAAIPLAVAAVAWKYRGARLAARLGRPGRRSA